MVVLKSASTAVERYGFPLRLEYDNPNFHGMQKGLSIGVLDNETNEIVNNYMPGDDKENSLRRILEDKDISIIEDGITQEVDGKFRKRTIYYLPYYVEGHSFLQPTVLYDNITYMGDNAVNKAKIEVIFSEDNLNRYAVFECESVNISVFDYIHDIFEEGIKDFPDIGVVYVLNEGEYSLDFYDQAGNRYDLYFSSLERLRDSIVSIRLIGIEHEVDIENGNESGEDKGDS